MESPIKIKTIYSSDNQLTMSFEFDPSQMYIAHINYMFPVITKLFISLLEYELRLKKENVYKVCFVLISKLYLSWPRISKHKALDVIYFKASNELIISQGDRTDKQRVYFKLLIDDECPRNSLKYKQNYEHLKNFNFMDSHGTITNNNEKPWKRFQEVHFDFHDN